MLYLYAVTTPPASLPSDGGIGENGLGTEPMGAIEAVVELLDGAVAPTEVAVLAHGRVVDALAAANEAVVPVRFGAAFSDAEALRGALAPRAEALAAALERVRGCVELGVRVLAPEEEEPGGRPRSGRDYILHRRAAVRAAERLADELHEPLAVLARASEHHPAATPRLVLSGAYLVSREDVDRFRAAFEELAGTHPELTCACTGPWPAYSFATVGVEAAA